MCLVVDGEKYGALGQEKYSLQIAVWCVSSLPVRRVGMNVDISASDVGIYKAPGRFLLRREIGEEFPRNIFVSCLCGYGRADYVWLCLGWEIKGGSHWSS